MDCSQLEKIFNSFNDLKVLVIGDCMVDSYLEGRVERISPEAPVPIVAVEKKQYRLGGAANVALNVKALGATPILCSVVGNDSDALVFKDLLKSSGIPDKGIMKSDNRPTSVKTRVIGNKHQMIRVDFETDLPLEQEETKQLLGKIRTILDEDKIDVIIFEDYDKGVITRELIDEVVAEAKKRNIPTAVDPKKRNFLFYRGVTLFKPNFKELKEGLKKDFLKMELSQVKTAIAELHQLLGNVHTFATLSELGVLIQSNDEHHYVPAHLRDIADVSGAGDTVISVAALCLALGEDMRTIAYLSNLAGGLVCEKVGVVPVDKEQFFREAASLINS